MELQDLGFFGLNRQPDMTFRARQAFQLVVLIPARRIFRSPITSR